ncbi:unnamed protein product [Nesidiocoris tenuis]|uniref:Uncharacterized protein n=1 Tax=Nesidiocoris tenuis TaxID=355587 RepID=A0A6H5GD37_9HEMI|nr:unnamed protein product [Nesidiocoris tenuis]
MGYLTNFERVPSFNYSSARTTRAQCEIPGVRQITREMVAFIVTFSISRTVSWKAMPAKVPRFFTVDLSVQRSRGACKLFQINALKSQSRSSQVRRVYFEGNRFFEGFPSRIRSRHCPFRRGIRAICFRNAALQNCRTTSQSVIPKGPSLIFRPSVALSLKLLLSNRPHRLFSDRRNRRGGGALI